MLNPATALARVLVDELARGGVREAVIAPGSRSAPLAIAFAEHPRIRLHVRIDERSAAFVGLGLAKASGNPVPIACTSGTAAANFYPAVLEASHSQVGLVVLTADRPPELRGTGANQTMDQIKLYGDAVRFFAELGVAEARTGMVAYWRSVICRALSAARGTGPVHLNVPFREPLVHDAADGAWPEALEGRSGGQPWTDAPPVSTLAEPLAELLDPPERGILVVGDGARAPGQAVAFAESAGWPIFAEPTSGTRLGCNAITTYSQLVAIPAVVEGYFPELIVTVGKPGLAKSLLELYPAVRHVVVDAGASWADPTRTAARVVPGLPGLAGLERTRDSSGWLAAWQRMESAARGALERILDQDPELSELRLAQDMVELAGTDAVLFVGSSMPIRCLDLAMRAGAGPWVLANRGVSGIDGCVSTAVGAALAHQVAGGGPSFAMLGDLSLIHDQNGLIIGPGQVRPDLTVVVVNNDGGGIFSFLPYAGMDQFETLFGTPHGVDLSHLATATGWEYHRVTAADELPGGLKGAGTRLIEIRTDRQRSAVLHRQVRDAVTAAALTAIGLHAGPR